jgi:hypothetical protein
MNCGKSSVVTGLSKRKIVFVISAFRCFLGEWVFPNNRGDGYQSEARVGVLAASVRKKSLKGNRNRKPGYKGEIVRGKC